MQEWYMRVYISEANIGERFDEDLAELLADLRVENAIRRALVFPTDENKEAAQNAIEALRTRQSMNR
jgi:hypothetical protein